MSFRPYSLNEIQILDHFVEMERRFKRQTERLYFPSLDYCLSDEEDQLNQLRREAENMVFFVGLGNMPIKLKLEKLTNAAACINLLEDSFIDITVDKDVFHDNNFYTIFSVLAHELGHKVLKTNGLWFSGLMAFENEIYADLSTFYLGFGKFVLNGYHYTEQKLNNIYNHSMGYLTHETYILAYVISEFLNGREPNTSGLEEETTKEIELIASQCKSKWIKDITSEESIKEHYKVLSKPVGTTSTIINLFEGFLEQESASVRSFITKLNHTCLKMANDTPLDCRKAAIAHAAFQNIHDLQSFAGASNLNTLIELMAIVLKEKGLKFDDVSKSLIHKCPNCGTHINNPSFRTNDGQRIFHIRCKKCQTQFVIDNNISQIKEHVQQHISFIDRIQSVLNKGNLSIVDILKSFVNSFQIFENNEKANSDIMRSQRLEINKLKENEARRNSMNWFQRLFSK